MGKSPLVSVLIECYNYERYIGCAVDSVLSQSYKNFELIIVDDCSTDNSKEIISSYHDDRIKFIKNKENLGFLMSRNNSLKMAKGKYVAYLDADDVWLPNKLTDQVSYLEKHPDVAAVFSDAYFIDQNGKYYDSNYVCDVPLDFYCYKTSKRSSIVRKFFDDSNFLCHTSAMLRKSVIDDLGLYDCRMIQVQDFEYWTRLVLNYEVYISSKKLLCVRRVLGDYKHLSAMSKSNCIRATHECAIVIYNMIKNIDASLFFASFSDFIKFEIKDSIDLIYAKYIVLLKWTYNGQNNQLPALVYITKLLTDSNLINELNNRYNFSLKNYYDAMGDAINLYPINFNDEYVSLSKELDELKVRISLMENSRSWKMLKPIRLISKKIRK